MITEHTQLQASALFKKERSFIEELSNRGPREGVSLVEGSALY
jgi:hypothetical protein